MNKKFTFIKSLAILFLSMSLCLSCSDKDDPKPVVDPDEEEPEDDRPSYESSEAVNPFSWIATDARGTTINPESTDYPDATEREGKFVGIFYFIWHGCHGYDIGANNNSVQPPTASDVKSPYDVNEMLKANPSDPQYGPGGTMHHWGEPYLGYYVSNDEWVIRKHGQMLSDAGVDVIFFDVTNGYSYIPVVKTICSVYAKMREEGGNTPQIAFLLNAATENTFNTIYNDFYSKNLYKNLWFNWLDKPLLLANPDEIPASYRNNFTIRRSWYLWNNAGADTWFGSGEDKWPWGGLYPQQAGKHNGKNESVSVMPATHPTSNIGRSYNASYNTQPSVSRAAEGIYFKSQFNRANSLDPSMMFFTGWNEWTAQRQIAANAGEVSFMGKPVAKGGTYFVDQYNHEFSRDIEPLNGDFGDNYYYMLVDYIRKFKGTKKLPVFKETNTVTIDGNLADWKSVKAMYADDKGDTAHRNHYGWGRVGQLVNNTGRNDIVLSKVTTDGTNLYFYVKTAENITSYKDKNWMKLFIKVNETAASWEGYNFVVNHTVVSEKETTLEKSKGGWSWQSVSTLQYKVSDNEMEMAIPLKDLGITTVDSFTIDFKWIDNAASDGDIQSCLRDGDSAPNGRFRYRYTFKK